MTPQKQEMKTKLDYVDVGKGLYYGEKMDTLIGSKAKPVLNMKECKKNGFVWAGKDHVFIDQSREGIPLVGIFRITGKVHR